MSTVAETRPSLPQLALDEWEDTKNTLHLWLQIVGKVRLASTAPRNHWWRVPLYVDVRGLTTRRMHAANGIAFEIRFDFIDHRLVIATNGGQVEALELVDGLSVAEFYETLHAALRRLRTDVTISESPYLLETTTPFPQDVEHAAYDRHAVEHFWRILDWSDGVFEEFAGWYCGKTSPVHLFWHSLDLAVTRFSGTRAPAMPKADAVGREAYSHEVISFGFWPGDQKVRMPAFFSYTAPEPAGLAEPPLRPEAASWQQPYGSSHLALLSYDEVRNSPGPRETLLEFLQSAYEARAATAGWDVDDLRSSWCSPVLAPSTRR
ncbi:MAG: DUF5996 family protein [Gaiellaceae bacterium]